MNLIFSFSSSRLQRALRSSLSCIYKRERKKGGRERKEKEKKEEKRKRTEGGGREKREKGEEGREMGEGKEGEEEEKGGWERKLTNTSCPQLSFIISNPPHKPGTATSTKTLKGN